MIDAHGLGVAVRWLHVVAMAIALGGAFLLLAFALRRDHGDSARQRVLLGAASYEWIFWTAVGVLAMTGVGNLAAFGAGLAGPGDTWGSTFVLKLVAVIALAVLSFPRTRTIAELLAACSVAVPRRVLTVVALAYGATMTANP